MSTDMHYLSRTPKSVPKRVREQGKILVHNVKWLGQEELGINGFRAWTCSPAPHLGLCDCGWAPEAGEHYRRHAVTIDPDWQGTRGKLSEATSVPLGQASGIKVTGTAFHGAKVKIPNQATGLSN